METILAILPVIGFLMGCYLVGNYFNDTFDEDLRTRLESSAYGILGMMVILVIICICVAIYTIALEFFKH